MQFFSTCTRMMLLIVVVFVSGCTPQKTGSKTPSEKSQSDPKKVRQQSEETREKGTVEIWVPRVMILEANTLPPFWVYIDGVLQPRDTVKSVSGYRARWFRRQGLHWFRKNGSDAIRGGRDNHGRLVATQGNLKEMFWVHTVRLSPGSHQLELAVPGGRHGIEFITRRVQVTAGKRQLAKLHPDKEIDILPNAVYQLPTLKYGVEFMSQKLRQLATARDDPVHKQLKSAYLGLSNRGASKPTVTLTLPLRGPREYDADAIATLTEHLKEKYYQPLPMISSEFKPDARFMRVYASVNRTTKENSKILSDFRDLAKRLRELE